MKKTYKEILDILNEKISMSQFGYQDYDPNELGLGEIKRIEEYGGEDMGTKWYTIDHFVEHDIYIKIDAEYWSYEGVIWDDASYEEVFPTSVTRIEYLNKNESAKYNKE